MSSLSIWTYYRNNKRKVLPVTVIIALAILAISSTGALTESLFSDVRREFAPTNHYAFVGSSQQGGLSDALVERITDHPTVSGAFRYSTRSTRTQGIFGEEGVRIFFLPAVDQQAFAERLGWRVIEGSWPSPGTNEVALTKNVLQNRGLKIGDRIGRAVDERDFLNGEWVIVGVFPAVESVGGIGDLEYLREHFIARPGLSAELIRRAFSLALVPVEGKERELEAFLDSLPPEEVFVSHRARAERELAESLANANMIIWVLNAVTVFVLALALGLLNIIFFMQRANEFGLLATLGYTKRFLVNRTFSEAAVTVVAGWALGIIVSQGIYSVMNALFFTPNGLSPLTILTPRVLTFTIPVPVTVTLFSVAIVLWQLVRMDPVAIIERRD